MFECLQDNDPLWYESKFNLAASMFKCGDFAHALQIITLLYRAVATEQLPFRGRDRRLYYNKALCEMQMGKYDDCIRTCKSFSALGSEIRQFVKVNCHPGSKPTKIPQASILNHFQSMHPSYNE
jgi:hypothetical protein